MMDMHYNFSNTSTTKPGINYPNPEYGKCTLMGSDDTRAAVHPACHPQRTP